MSTLTSSNTPFYGSVMPAGELFHIYWRAQDFSNTEPTASFITDIKITKNKPDHATEGPTLISISLVIKTKVIGNAINPT